MQEHENPAFRGAEIYHPQAMRPEEFAPGSFQPLSYFQQGDEQQAAEEHPLQQSEAYDGFEPVPSEQQAAQLQACQAQEAYQQEQQPQECQPGEAPSQNPDAQLPPPNTGSWMLDLVKVHTMRKPYSQVASWHGVGGPRTVEEALRIVRSQPPKPLPPPKKRGRPLGSKNKRKKKFKEIQAATSANRMQPHNRLVRSIASSSSGRREKTEASPPHSTEASDSPQEERPSADRIKSQPEESFEAPQMGVDQHHSGHNAYGLPGH